MFLRMISGPLLTMTIIMPLKLRRSVRNRTSLEMTRKNVKDNLNEYLDISSPGVKKNLVRRLMLLCTIHYNILQSNIINRNQIVRYNYYYMTHRIYFN